MDRRSFISGLAALGCAGTIGKAEASPLVKMAGKMAPEPPKAKFDDNLVVLISDVHCDPEGYEPQRIKSMVDDILKMKPLPRNVIALGDLAYLTGKVSEYTLLRTLIEPIEKAGITLTLGMGNHDRREEFDSIFPEHKAKSVFGMHRYVYIVETPHADFIVLDSLQQGDDKTTWIGGGALDAPQREWLEKTLASYTKPVFVCAHHGVGELKIGSLLVDTPACCGFIHGHDHRWRKDWLIRNYREHRTVNMLCLPSVSCWGDIGYTTVRITPEKLVAQITEKEFYFPFPAESPDKEPKAWKIKAEETNGDTCSFSLQMYK